MNCLECGKEYSGRKRRYCSESCRYNHEQKTRKIRYYSDSRIKDACKIRQRKYNKIHLNDEVYMNHQRELKKKSERKLKLEVFIHYGGSPPKCACCSETEFVFLSIDHINGGGSKHRREIRKSIYRWLKHNNFPEGYQVLCFNCNEGKRIKGICPHQEEIELL